MVNKPKIFFTMHRSGSTVLASIVSKICMTTKTSFVNVSSLGPGALNEKMLQGTSITACPVRLCARVNRVDENLMKTVESRNDQFDVIWNIRDPRDVAVSMFYSFCYGHAGVGGQDKIGKFREAGIDDFMFKVLFNKNFIQRGTGDTTSLYDRYKYVCNTFLNKATVVKYEEMVTDFESWLIKLESVYGPMNRKRVCKFAKPKFKVGKENPNSLKRQITPGDYKRKLKKETIEEINDRMGVILKLLNYECEV